MTWWRLTFARGGPARYLSHLDTSRALQRTFARAGIPLSLSQGLRPKPRISLPLPLPVGAAGCEELAVAEVVDAGPDAVEALRLLRSAAPPGIVVLAVESCGEQRPRPRALEAEYSCVVDGDAGALLAAVERYGGEERAPYERVSPKGRRTLDLKEFVSRTDAEAMDGGARLSFTVKYREDGAARPQEYVGLVASWAGAEAAMRELERRRIAWEMSPRGSSRAAGRSESW